VNATLTAWNEADQATATNEMMAVCGAHRWAAKMVALRPVASVAALSESADRVWAAMEEADWLEAFAAHPRIGARTKAPGTSAQSAAWSQQEQSASAKAAQKIMDQLAEGNARYEEKFGFTYIVCATGKSAEEMLAILNRRLQNDRAHELREAAEQQRQIMQIRLGKWLIQ
jgi:OHCU decarboxylase